VAQESCQSKLLGYKKILDTCPKIVVQFWRLKMNTFVSNIFWKQKYSFFKHKKTRQKAGEIPNPKILGFGFFIFDN